MEEKIKDFIERKGGRATYKSWLKRFFETIDAEPDNYFNQKHNYDLDILKFAESIKLWAPATKKSAISCLKNFFKFCNVRLQPATEYSLKEYAKGPSAISQELVPDRDLIIVDSSG